MSLRHVLLYYFLLFGAVIPLLATSNQDFFIVFDSLEALDSQISLIPCQLSHVFRLVAPAVSVVDCEINRLQQLENAQIEVDETVTGDSTFVQDVGSFPLNYWWLDRLDQADNDLDGLYRYRYTGAGVEIYIFDSGIRNTHTEFTNRSSCGFTLLDSCDDQSGHGTGVASIAGGVTYGVAKNASLVNVRVLNERTAGPVSGILAGIEYVLAQKQQRPEQPMVVNMSL